MQQYVLYPPDPGECGAVRHPGHGLQQLCYPGGSLRDGGQGVCGLLSGAGVRLPSGLLCQSPGLDLRGSVSGTGLWPVLKKIKTDIRRIVFYG